MMKRICHRRPAAALLVVCTMILCLPLPARADFRHQHMGARPKAMGSAYVSLADDANAVYWNPAGLARNRSTSVMATRAWLYGLDDLSNDYLAVAVPHPGGLSFGASWVRLGIDNIYSEDTLNLAFAAPAPLLKGLSVGIAGKMFLLDAPGYRQYNDPNYQGSDHDFSFDLGLLYDSRGPWTLGATIYNVLTPTLQLISTTADPDPVYTEWAVGGSYLFRETLLVTADMRNREGEWTNTVLDWGAEIWFYNTLVLRSGMDAGMVTLGAGLQDKHWRLGLALEANNKLGDVYMLSFTLRK